VGDNFLNNGKPNPIGWLHRPVARPAWNVLSLGWWGYFETENVQARSEWQTAIAALCLVLAVAARE